ncbi:uncharacterized protein LOC122815385 [Protopterus annectens]|uniref:uncharacterized protein LOC122815385 n=1 Tax=Protopterus annectens TaxID=7888 RepID=UPI001CFB781F|nr:uncharacterized protein LOC122815385 [Protopterus annectens]
MPRLTLFIFSLYLMTTSAQSDLMTTSAQSGYPGMPQIQVSPQVTHQLGSRVTITCVNGYDYYTVRHCALYKEKALLPHLSSSISATWYTIESATSKDEGFYACHCQVYNPVYLWWEHIETIPSFRLVLNTHYKQLCDIFDRAGLEVMQLMIAEYENKASNLTDELNTLHQTVTSDNDFAMVKHDYDKIFDEVDQFCLKIMNRKIRKLERDLYEYREELAYPVIINLEVL